MAKLVLDKPRLVPDQSRLVLDEPQGEQAFQQWYKQQAAKTGIDPNPDDPRHKYDYRAAFRAGVEPVMSPADNRYHWDSRFKASDHPNRYVDGIDTKTGLPSSAEASFQPTPETYRPANLVYESPADPSDISGFSSPADPSDISGFSSPASPLIRGFTKAVSYQVDIGMKGLGVIAWPFERVEGSIATPVVAAIEARRKTLRRMGKGDIGPGVLKPGTLPKKEAMRELKEIWPAVKAVAESWIPGREMPEEVKNFNDFAGTYYNTMTGEDAPAWYKNMFGLGLSFGVTPTATSKIMKGVFKVGKLTKIPQKIAAKSLPAWKRAQLIRRAKTGAGIERAEEIGKQISGKKVKKLAKALTKATGKPISTQAVEHRMGQLIKGGITTRPELAKAVHPAIEQFEANAKILRGMGILGKETFLTKLPKKRIAELTAKKVGLQKQLTRLKTSPHYVGTPEISARFPGRAAKIKGLQSEIDDITGKIQQSFKVGGQKYLPRMYRSKEEEQAARKFVGWSKSRIRAHYAKQRKDIPEEVRRIMGEIKEPAFPVTKRLIQQASDIETAKLYKFAAKQPGWASKEWVKGLSKKALPDDKAYGALRGMYVHPKIYSDVTELHRIKNNVESLYDAAIGSWKMGKVVLNPSTHMRNKISNKILLDLSGMGYVEQAKYAIKGLKHARSNSKEYQIAKQYFARTTQVSGELLDDMLRTTAQAKGVSGFEKGLNATKRGVKWITKKPSDLYQHEEFTNKFMKYLQQRDKGKSVIESVEEANKWLFDYGDLATWEKNIARRIVPFYTFPRKAIPRVLEAAVENPMTLAKYPLAAEVMTRYSLAKLEMTDKDYEQLQKVLPDYMDKGSYMLMPYRDKNGDLRFFDWTYILPWGELSQVGETTNVGNILLSNPIVRIPAEIATNKSVWSGRKIYDDEIPPGEQTPEYKREQTVKKMKYFWGTLMPSLAPKGLYWDRMFEAAKGTPIKTVTGKPKKRLLPETLAHTLLGLRTQAIDVEDQKYYRLWDKQRQIKEVQSKMKDIEMRKHVGNISEDEYQKRREIYIEQMENVIKAAKKIIK